jgi:hypothetical protein
MNGLNGEAANSAAGERGRHRRGIYFHAIDPRRGN